MGEPRRRGVMVVCEWEVSIRSMISIGRDGWGDGWSRDIAVGEGGEGGEGWVDGARDGGSGLRLLREGPVAR